MAAAMQCVSLSGWPAGTWRLTTARAQPSVDCAGLPPALAQPPSNPTIHKHASAGVKVRVASDNHAAKHRSQAASQPGAAPRCRCSVLPGNRNDIDALSLRAESAMVPAAIGPFLRGCACRGRRIRARRLARKIHRTPARRPAGAYSGPRTRGLRRPADQRRDSPVRVEPGPGPTPRTAGLRASACPNGSHSRSWGSIHPP